MTANETVSLRRIASVLITTLSLVLAPAAEVWAAGRGGGGGFRGGGGFGGGGGGFRGGGGFNGGGGFRGGGGFNGGNFNAGGFRGGAGGGFNGNFSGGNRTNVAGNRGNFERGNANRIANGGERFPNAGNRADRIDNRGDRISNRGDRIDNRGDRIDNRGDRINNRNDYWRNVHNNWYHGYWHGHWGNGWWYAHPWATWGIGIGTVGLASWAYGSLFYDLGYSPYYNPYYVAPVDASYPAYDYSQPIMTTADPPEQNDPSVTSAVSDADRARDLFYKEDYSAALSAINAAISRTPSDTPLHEMRGLILFAMGRYKEAAAALYAVLSVGPGWDWTTMSSLYPNVDVYTKQLRKLEDYTRQYESSPELHFVLGYQYMTAGYTTAATHQFEQVVKLVPNDQVSRQLLAMLQSDKSGSDSSATASAEAPPAAPATPPDTQLTAPANIAGAWHAAAVAGGTIDLSLGNDGRFAWKYARPDKTQSFDGKYELAGTTLVLDYDNGGTMVAKVNAEGPDRFSFKMVGGPPNDPGLTFAR